MCSKLLFIAEEGEIEMAVKENRYELTIGDDLYPARLLDLPDAPERLYVRGDPAVLAEPSLSVIGSRRASPYGLAVAEMVGKLAAESGLVEVSGGARGCDAAGGLAALDNGGRHVVVLGSGADVIYPRSSAGLIERALETGGAVVSLCPWGSPPQRFAFPRRNRIIAALSEALFISEAGMPSGTFSTAETAMQIGREVLVAPGSILSPESRGSNYLIGCGACCITDEESIEIAISRIYGTLRYDRCAMSAPPNITGDAGRVLRALIACPMRVDDIQDMIGYSVVETSLLLSSMEVDGLCERMVDGRYAPTKIILHAQTPLGQNECQG